MAVDQMYLENLEEFVLDESKVVTYKWFSHTIQVHVNVSKQMLYTFVQKQRNEKDNDALSVTYLVVGVVTDGDSKGQRVCIVPEEQLEATKSRMSPVTSCHVYSVQKAKLKDNNALYIADYDLLRDNMLASNKYSAITCMAAKLRSEVDVAQSREEEPAHQPYIKPKAEIKPQKNSLPSSFAKSSKKKEVKTEKSPEDKAKRKEKEPESGKQKPTAGVMSFFNKQAANGEKKPKEYSEQSSASESKQKSPVKSSEEIKVEEKSPKPESEKQDKKTRGKKNKASEKDEEASSGSKRRKLQKALESSSEEEDMDEDEAPIPPTPPPSPPPKEPSTEPAPAPKSTVSKEGGGKMTKRVRKLVSKQHVNEEGFMVTEKVYEDEEVEIPAEEEKETATEQTSAEEKTATEQTSAPTKGAVKQEKKKSPPKKKPAKKGTGKQTNMMSFFKKM